MSVLPSDLMFVGSANMREVDTGTQGGALDATKKVTFDDISPTGTVEVVSSNAGDTTQTVTVTSRDASGVLQTDVIALNGTTPVAGPDTCERLMKAVKSATTVGDVAAMATTNDATGTAQAGVAKTASEMAYITAAAGGITTNGQYRGKVLRTTGGTGPNQIREIIDTRDSDDRIWVGEDWDVVPDATTTYEIADGMVFEKNRGSVEVLEVRRPFYDVAADVAGGSARDYYEKIFVENNHATLALTNATIAESADPSGKITFGLETTLDGAGTSTDRRTAPASGVSAFDNSTKDVANSKNHTPGAAQGVWMKLSLAAGDPATKSSYTLQETGTST